MAFTIRSASTAVVPTGTPTGSLLIVLVTDDTNTSFTAAGGWTILDQGATALPDGQTWATVWNPSGGAAGSAVSPISQTFTSIAVISIVGAAGVSPINAHTGQPDGGSGTAPPWTITAPAITPSVANCLLLWVAGIDPNLNNPADDVFTPPAGFSGVITVSSGFDGLYVAQKTLSGGSGVSTGNLVGSDTRTSGATASTFGGVIALAPGGALFDVSVDETAVALTDTSANDRTFDRGGGNKSQTFNN
jgi:hypothetical protein